ALREKAAVGQEVLELAARVDRLGIDGERAAHTLARFASDVDGVATGGGADIRFLGYQQIRVVCAVREHSAWRHCEQSRDGHRQAESSQSRHPSTLLHCPEAGRSHQW